MMNRLLSLLFGAGLVLTGLFALAGMSLLPALGIVLHIHWWEVWRLWPLCVVGLGLFLAGLGLFSLKKPAMGAVFIPAIPILAVGTILLAASVFDAWEIWRYAWSLVILSLALGFVLAAIFGRNIWLGIPAILIGLNGLALAFTSLSGAWGSWSILWTIEPLAIGLILLLVAVGDKRRSRPVFWVGLSVCAFAGLSFISMVAILLLGPWLFRLLGPALLILVGGVVMVVGLLRRTPTPETAAQ